MSGHYFIYALMIGFLLAGFIVLLPFFSLLFWRKMIHETNKQNVWPWVRARQRLLLALFFFSLSHIISAVFL